MRLREITFRREHGHRESEIVAQSPPREPAADHTNANRKMLLRPRGDGSNPRKRERAPTRPLRPRRTTRRPFRRRNHSGAKPEQSLFVGDLRLDVDDLLA